MKPLEIDHSSGVGQGSKEKLKRTFWNETMTLLPGPSDVDDADPEMFLPEMLFILLLTLKNL